MRGEERVRKSSLVISDQETQQLHRLPKRKRARGIGAHSPCLPLSLQGSPITAKLAMFCPAETKPNWKSEDVGNGIHPPDVLAWVLSIALTPALCSPHFTDGEQNQASLSHLPKAILVQQLLYSNNYRRGNLWREITEIEMLFLDEYLK